MTIPVNFKSFEELCPTAKIDIDKKQCYAYFMADAVKNDFGCYLVKKKIETRTYYKCGYKGKTVSNRLDKYNVQDIICLGFIFGENSDISEFDIEIHRKQEQFYNIEFDGCIFEGSDEEWCHLENYKDNDAEFIEKTIKACSLYRNNIQPKAEKTMFWGPRIGSQDKCIEKAIAYWSKENSNDYFLEGGKCRFGKCYTSLKICQELENKNLINSRLHLIQTYRPSDTSEEWIDTIIFHNDFEYDIFVHPSILNKYPNYEHVKSYDELNEQSSGFVFSSAQLLIRQVDNDYGKYSKLLQQFNYGVELKDEDDVGCNKDNSLSFSINNIKAEKHLRITGTPYDEIINETDKFNDENVNIWDYVDEQKAKEKYVYLGTNNPYKDMAQINLNQVDLAKNLYNEAAKNNPNEFSDVAFTLNEFQRVNDYDESTFVHSLQVEDFWKKTLSIKFCDEDEEQYSIFNRFDIRHALVKVPSKTLSALKKLLSDLSTKHKSIAERYEFIFITGDSPDVKTNKELKSKIAKADSNDKISICFTIYKDCRGVGIGYWNAVLHLSGTEDSDVCPYEQTNFRGQTPFKNKNLAYVFDYAPNRCLTMLSKLAAIRAKTHHLQYETSIKELLNYSPVFKVCNMEWKQFNYKKLIEDLREIRDEKQIENNVIINSPLGFIENQTEFNEKFELNKTNYLNKLKKKLEKNVMNNGNTDVKPNDISLTEEQKEELRKKLEEKYNRKQQKNFFNFFKKTLKFVWVKNNGLPFDINIYHKFIYDEEVKTWLSHVYTIPENFYILFEEAYKNHNWIVSVEEFLKLTYDNKKFDDICPTVISKNKSDYKTPDKIVSICWSKVKTDKINNFVEVCSKCGEYAKFGINNYNLDVDNCKFIVNSTWCAALTSLNIYNDYNYTKHKTIKIVNLEDKKIKNKFNIKELFNMSQIDLLLGNPPYGIKVESGRKRSIDLDLPIWDELKKQSPTTEIHLLMKSTHSHKNGHGFTEIENLGNNQFDGVNQEVSLYTSVNGCSELHFTHNKHKDKHDWIQKNDKSNTGHTLNQMIDHKYESNHPNTTIVPNNCIVMSQVCTKNLTIWLPGESLIKTNGKVHTMKVFIPTSKPNELKQYLINNLQTKHNEYRKQYKDQNIDRGFAKTFEIPDEYWIKNDFIE